MMLKHESGAAPSLEVLDKLRRAGRIASTVREAGATRIVPGARLRDVCAFVEDEIARLGGAPAFPVQTSVNHVAAHYCPGVDDATRYAEGDLAKLDIGVHVDGWVVDTATTAWVGRPGGRHPLVEAARAALEAAIAVAGPLVPVRRLSRAIEASLRHRGLRPMRNLCGHGVARYTVHCPPAIPNIADGSSERLAVGTAVALEPFATEGLGLVAERGAPEVFRLDPLQAEAAGSGTPLFEAIRAFRGLPFARHQLPAFPRATVEDLLESLRARGLLMAYAPLVETNRRPVAQAEHTIYIGETGIEILTA